MAGYTSIRMPSEKLRNRVDELDNKERYIVQGKQVVAPLSRYRFPTQNSSDGAALANPATVAVQAIVAEHAVTPPWCGHS